MKQSPTIRPQRRRFVADERVRETVKANVEELRKKVGQIDLDSPSTTRMANRLAAIGSVLFLSCMGAALVACPANVDDSCAGGTCIARVTSEGGADAAADGPPVDACATVPPDPKCLDESVTVFVSAAGNDTNVGTKTAPFKTISAALKAASAEKKRVYVCEGSYPENVQITKTIAVIGGISCTWDAKGARAKIAPAKGTAVTITKTATVSLTELSITASADTHAKGDSAIGVFVSESQSVLLKSVDVTAGAGVDGNNGANGEESPNYAGAFAASGNTTSDAAGAPAPTCGTCTDGTSSAGGKGAANNGAPDPGSADPAVGANNAGGTVGGVCSAGNPGAGGTAATSSAAGATASGTLIASGWKLDAAGAKGVNGRPGQGGGGGGFQGGFGGGSGGCGGCGGTGGAPGTNGGSSIAVATFNSEVLIEDCTLTSAKGGSGGTGGKGQDGQFRGNAGGGACSGGVGGHGAGGGGGGGGAGGHSATIAFVGTKPTTTRSTLKPGAGGAFGEGGGAGAGPGNPGPPGNPGAKGDSKDILAL